MTPKQFEREVRNGCRVILNNRKLKDEDIREWATSLEHVKKNLRPETEILVENPVVGVYCVVLKTADKRKI
jgi:hypothetical protein